MADLTLHAVPWCVQHGHPVLTMRTGDDRFFAVAVSVEDAGARALTPAGSVLEKSSRRAHALVEAAIAALGARLSEIRLHVGGDAMLRDSLRLHGPAGEVALPAHFADGVALAQRGRLPIRIVDEALRRVPLAALDATEPTLDARSLPAAFRSLIESLDLDELDGTGGDNSAMPPRQAQ
jgi:bifunctional DNase/RNase